MNSRLTLAVTIFASLSFGGDAWAYKNDKGPNGCKIGGDPNVWGCCGNESTAINVNGCAICSSICYDHDAACPDCAHWWCLWGCQPELEIAIDPDDIGPVEGGSGGGGTATAGVTESSNVAWEGIGNGVVTYEAVAGTLGGEEFAEDCELDLCGWGIAQGMYTSMEVTSVPDLGLMIANIEAEGGYAIGADRWMHQGEDALRIAEFRGTFLVIYTSTVAAPHELIALADSIPANFLR